MAQWSVTTSGATLAFTTNDAAPVFNSCVKIDANHFVVNYKGGGQFRSQSITVNTTTWAVTTASSQLVVENGSTTHNQSIIIDTNHFLCIWRNSAGNNGVAQSLVVNTTTWAVTTAASSLNFDAGFYGFTSITAIDANHFVCFYAGTDFDGFAQVFTINTTTWAVTTSSSSLEFDTTRGYYNNSAQVDATHFLNIWGGGVSSYGIAQVFAVNTSTWAITTAGSSFNFYTDSWSVDSLCVIDSNHFYVNGNTGPIVLTVNTSTWAVTTANTGLDWSGLSSGSNLTCIAVDSNHFIQFWEGSGSDGFTTVFAVNTTTWAVTTTAAYFEFDTVSAFYNATAQIDSSHFINFWGGGSSAADDGVVQVFTVDLTGPRGLKTINGLSFS